jgi:hypothetical protein
MLKTPLGTVNDCPAPVKVKMACWAHPVCILKKNRHTVATTARATVCVPKYPAMFTTLKLRSLLIASPL